jgi:signal transduction histidine kinase
MRMDQQHTNVGADVLASGIHDAKNRLFEAQTLLARAEREQGVSLPDARFAITGAAVRLSRTLVAYRLMRDQQPIAIMPVPVVELVEDAVIAVRSQFEREGIALAVDVGFPGEWPLDRTLCVDVLVNALQNACRHAGATVRIMAEVNAEGLCLGVNDDGSGFPDAAFEKLARERSGLGLFIAARIAALHERKGRRGSLTLANGGTLGGAMFRCVFP